MGPNAAARLQRRMTEHVVSEARTLTKQVKVCVSFDGGLAEDFRAWLGDDLHYAPEPAQPQGPLAEALIFSVERLSPACA